jgi:hypothetical protein
MVSLSRTAKGNVAVAAAVVGAVAVHGGAALFFASHDPYHSQVFPTCPFLAVTGLQCPGCGGTRAMYSLLHGDVVGAVRMNPLVLVLYPVVLGYGASLLAEYRAQTRLARVLSWSAFGLLMAGVLYSGLVRNLLPH